MLLLDDADGNIDVEIPIPEVWVKNNGEQGLYGGAVDSQDDLWALVFIDAETIEIKQTVSIGHGRRIRGFWWANDERVIASVTFNNGVMSSVLGVNRDGSRYANFSDRAWARGGAVLSPHQE